MREKTAVSTGSSDRPQLQTQVKCMGDSLYIHSVQVHIHTQADWNYKQRRSDVAADELVIKTPPNMKKGAQ